MKFWLFCDITAVVLLTAIAAVYLPEIPQKHGSLYEGIILLIGKEKLNAEMYWIETQHQINESFAVLNMTLDHMPNYEAIINEKIQQLTNLQHTDELKKCYKKYERQIARFNRDIIQNYRFCKQALNSSLSQLKAEIATEIAYIRDAAIEIQELTYDCNVNDLKKTANDMNHVGVALCVISKLGEINQHMFEASQICLDIMARFSVEDFNAENHIRKMKGMSRSSICLDFQYIRDEFETIYANVMLCVNDTN